MKKGTNLFSFDGPHFVAPMAFVPHNAGHCGSSYSAESTEREQSVQ